MRLAPLSRRSAANVDTPPVHSRQKPGRHLILVSPGLQSSLSSVPGCQARSGHAFRSSTNPARFPGKPGKLIRISKIRTSFDQPLPLIAARLAAGLSESTSRSRLFRSIPGLPPNGLDRPELFRTFVDHSAHRSARTTRPLEKTNTGVFPFWGRRLFPDDLVHQLQKRVLLIQFDVPTPSVGSVALHCFRCISRVGRSISFCLRRIVGKFESTWVNFAAHGRPAFFRRLFVVFAER